MSCSRAPAGVKNAVPGRPANSRCSCPPPTASITGIPSSGPGAPWLSRFGAAGMMNRSPWAWRPAWTGISRSRSRWSCTSKPYLSMSWPSVAVVTLVPSVENADCACRWVSCAPHHLRVVVLAQARRPCGCLDRVADSSRYFQAVAAPGAIAFGSAVGAHEQTDPVAPQPLGDVVEDQMLPRVAGVRHLRSCRVRASARGDGHEPRLGDELIPAERLDCAAADPE